MDMVIIAVAVIVVIALSASAGVLFYVIFRYRKQKMQKHRLGKVFVKQGMDVKKQMISDGRGEYFPGGREEQETCLADPSVKLWRIRLDNLHTGEELSAEFIARLWIGRSESDENSTNMLVIRGDSKISRNHCLISQRGNSLYVQDMNSSNHTYLNGQPVTEPVHLRNGDILRMGDTEMKVRYTIIE